MLWTIYALHTVSKLCDCSLLWKPIELSKPINCVFFLFQVRILIFHQVRSPNLLAISHGTNFSADEAYSSNEDENNTPHLSERERAEIGLFRTWEAVYSGNLNHQIFCTWMLDTGRCLPSNKSKFVRNFSNYRQLPEISFEFHLVLCWKL